MLFKKKNLVLQESLGEYLKKIRLGKNWSYQTAALETNINVEYLKAIEDSEYNKIPGEIYLKNFIKKYALSLGLSQSRILEKYQEEKDFLFVQKRNLIQETSEKSFWHFFLSPKFLRLCILSVFIGLLFIYLTASFYKFISPPFLKIQFPEDNLIVESKTITILGQTEKEVVVKINNKNVFVEENGSFKGEINLKNNLNLIVITAKRKYGWERKIERSILVKETFNNIQATGNRNLKQFFPNDEFLSSL